MKSLKWNSVVHYDFAKNKKKIQLLILRAQTLVSEETDKAKEIQHVKQALKANNYSHWMLTTPKIGCMYVCILNWPLPIGVFQDQYKQTMINKYSNEHKPR